MIRLLTLSVKLNIDTVMPLCHFLQLEREPRLCNSSLYRCQDLRLTRELIRDIIVCWRKRPKWQCQQLSVARIVHTVVCLA